MLNLSASTATASRARPARKPARDYQYATSLVHGLDLLRCFRLAEPLLSNGELAHRTGLSKATVTRLTYTLTLLGFLRFDTVLRKYRLGSASITVGYPLLVSLQVRQVARPLMHALATEVGGAVSLGMRDRTQMVYLETCRARDLVELLPDIGASIPMLPTAMGRAWLARAPRAHSEAVQRWLRLEAPETWRRLQPELDAARKDMARFGYCFTRGDFHGGVHAAAAPLDFSVEDELLIFNCSIPARDASSRAQEDALGRRLRALADEVRRRLEAEEGTRDATRH
ncbi:MAG: IclR family transcriptional regulator [Cupriavidus necator]